METKKPEGWIIIYKMGVLCALVSNTKCAAHFLLRQRAENKWQYLFCENPGTTQMCTNTHTYHTLYSEQTHFWYAEIHLCSSRLAQLLLTFSYTFSVSGSPHQSIDPTSQGRWLVLLGSVRGFCLQKELFPCNCHIVLVLGMWVSLLRVRHRAAPYVVSFWHELSPFQ